MPRYFFTLHLGPDILRDPDGQSLRDPDQAWEVARAMARDLMRTQFERPINWVASHIEVTDEAGEIVLEFPFPEAMLDDDPGHRA